LLTPEQRQVKVKVFRRRQRVRDRLLQVKRQTRLLCRRLPNRKPRRRVNPPPTRKQRLGRTRIRESLLSGLPSMSPLTIADLFRLLSLPVTSAHPALSPHILNVSRPPLLRHGLPPRTAPRQGGTTNVRAKSTRHNGFIMTPAATWSISVPTKIGISSTRRLSQSSLSSMGIFAIVFRSNGIVQAP
jgi:hypothetical protein